MAKNKKYNNVPEPKMEFGNNNPYQEILNHENFLKLSPFVESRIKTIKDYCDAMAPGHRVNKKDIVHNHAIFFNAMLAIINAQNEQDFTEGMDELMKLFKSEAQRALNIRYTQRNMQDWIIDDKKRTLYSNLCLIFSVFMDDTERHLYGDTMNLTGEDGMLNGLDYNARSRVLAYLKRLMM